MFIYYNYKCHNSQQEVLLVKERAVHLAFVPNQTINTTNNNETIGGTSAISPQRPKSVPDKEKERNSNSTPSMATITRKEWFRAKISVVRFGAMIMVSGLLLKKKIQKKKEMNKLGGNDEKEVEKEEEEDMFVRPLVLRRTEVEKLRYSSFVVERLSILLHRPGMWIRLFSGRVG